MKSAPLFKQERSQTAKTSRSFQPKVTSRNSVLIKIKQKSLCALCCSYFDWQKSWTSFVAAVTESAEGGGGCGRPEASCGAEEGVGALVSKIEGRLRVEEMITTWSPRSSYRVRGNEKDTNHETDD